MSNVFDLYGILNADIDTMAYLLEKALKVSFKPHDSDFWGEYYLARNEDWSEQFSLKENFNQMEEDWNEPDFKDYPLTLEISVESTARTREIETNLTKVSGTKIVLLRRNEYPDENANE
jgi:hypothetical protein